MNLKPILLLLLFIPVALAAQVDPDVLEDLEINNEAKVIIELVHLPENPLLSVLGIEQTTEDRVDKAQQQALANIRQQDFLFLQQEAQIKYQYQNIYAIAATITKKALTKLESNQAVKTIIKDRVATISLSESIPQIGADTVHNLGYKGAGQYICILDTGVEYTHQSLGNCTETEFLNGNCEKVPAGHDFFNNDNNPIDDNGHGTHVAGIVASDPFISSSKNHIGVAPDAKILAVKICGSSGVCPTSDIVAGIEWCTQQKSTYNIAAMSLSLGSGSFDNEQSCKSSHGSEAEAVALAANANISVVAASGNSGFTNGTSAPACLPNATSVGSVNPDDSIHSLTNRAKNLDLLAPGKLIKSTYINNQYSTQSGTSQATPHVAAAIALMKQANPNLNNTDIIKLLNNTGTLIFDSSAPPSTQRSYSRINIDQAIAIVQTTITLNLSKGWNIISIPLEVNNSLPGIFEPIKSKITSIKTMDSDETTLTFDPTSNSNTLTQLNLSKGILINMKEPLLHQITGTARTNSIYTASGWNLIAYPLTQSTNPSSLTSNSGITKIYTHTNNTWFSYQTSRTSLLNTLLLLEPTKGYWVYTTSNETISLS
ncbi:MAG: S8 family serine peptidase [Nanoarchaeota archaeon]|nr:S8 family serine peptidase [Nanoarchaeota archaeon]